MSVHGCLTVSVCTCAYMCIFACVSPWVAIYFVSLCVHVLITQVGYTRKKKATLVSNQTACSRRCLKFSVGAIEKDDRLGRKADLG